MEAEKDDTIVEPASGDDAKEDTPSTEAASTETEAPNANANADADANANAANSADEDDTKVDDIILDDSTASEASDDSDTNLAPGEDPLEMVIKATTHKEDGNGHFKAGDLEKAVRSYRKGTNLLKPLNKNNTGDEQVKALLVTLQNNLSMIFFKQQKNKVSRDIATKSLKIEPNNVKALYRRAVAHKKMGDLEKARDDLKEALKHDAKNVAVRKELISIKKALLDFKEKQKKAMQGAFSKGSASLYEDKEREIQRKLEEKKRQKELEEKAKEARKVQWEDECVSRMAKDEPAVSFEEWEKERDEADKKKKEEEEKRQKDERKARQAAKEAADATKNDDSDDSSDDELTPSELASLRGYKKTADGRVTSYFNNEQSEHVKNAIGDITPQRLDSASSSLPQLLSASSGEDGGDANGPSAWNQAGTWEEKDTTKWCTDLLEERFKETSFSMQSESLEQYRACVSKVDNLTGDASVANTNGKKRYIFDYHAKIIFEIRDADVDEILAEGSLHLPDICSTTHDELEVNFTGWKKSPSTAHRNNVNECMQSLASEVRATVQKWVQDFNQQY